jgi:hypothetical protein
LCIHGINDVQLGELWHIMLGGLQRPQQVMHSPFDGNHADPLFQGMDVQARCLQCRVVCTNVLPEILSGTWQRLVLCHNPTLAKCGGEAQHLEKLEVKSLPRLLNVQSSIARGKTPCIGVFLMSLKRS